MEVPTQELHRRPTLSHFMSRVESSSNLRDLLKVRQDDAEAAAAARRRGAEATRTLATILACEKRDLTSDPSSSSSSVSSVVNRTLLDIIRDEQEPNNRMMPNGAVGPEGLGGGPGGNRGGGAVVVNWKALRDRLRLRRANEVLQASAAFGEGSQRRVEEEQGQGTSLQPVSGAEGPRPLVSILEAAPVASEESPAAPERAAPTTTAGTTTGDDTASTSTPRSQDGQQPRVTNPPAASSNSRPQPPPPARQPRPQQPRQRPPQSDEPTRVSLMALLEQADRTGGGVGGPSFAAAVVGLVQEDAHGEEGHDHRPAGAGGADESLLCCVCMVRNKGAAFIPCGHTFCRLCTRELWVSRGTCPLCNGFILEILDIF